MKIVFDTNVYIAEALRGPRAISVLETTERAGWRVYVSTFLVDEVERVLVRLTMSRKMAMLARSRILRRATLIEPVPSRHEVPADPQDGPILRGALSAGADYLVSNDRHLLTLNPYEGLQILSLDQYEQLLRSQGLLG